MGRFEELTGFGRVAAPQAVRSRALHHFQFLVFFYVLVPSFLALLSGLSSSGNQALSHPHYYVVYWLCTAIPAWIAAGLGTSVVSRIVRPFLDLDRFHMSFVLVLVLGYLVGINALWMPLSQFRNDLLGGLAMPGQSLRHAWEPTSSYLAIYQVVHGIACWVGFNYFAAAIFGTRRFGFHVDTSLFTRAFDRAKIALEGRDLALQDMRRGLNQMQVKARDELVDRIAPYSLDRIVTLHAEDHYTHVCFDDRELLIYMPFSSAMQGVVSLDGFQTHRSYWVRIDSIRRPVTKGGKKFLELYTGRLIPISRARKDAFRHLIAGQRSPTEEQNPARVAPSLITSIKSA